MGYIPPRPVGDSAEAVYHQAVWDAIFGGKFPFINQPDCLWNIVSGGYYPTIKSKGGGASPTQKYFPFRVYRSPLPPSPTETQSANAWRTYRVRNGAVVGNTPTPIEVLGSDLVADPDSSFRPAYSAGLEILLPLPTSPAETADYWVWLDIDEGSATAQVQHSASPPASWTLTRIPICKVTIGTEETQTISLRQYLRSDVIIPCLNFPAE